MNKTLQQPLVLSAGAAALVWMTALTQLSGQTPPDEHASHHEVPSDMSKMMKPMLPAPAKEFFPSLMEMRDVTPAERAEMERLAHERMEQGLGLLKKGLDELSAAQRWTDYAAMERATDRMHDGLDRFETGVAAHRALAEGQAPKTVALAWFKKQMSLPQARPAAATELDRLTPFHLFVMILIALFLVVMAWVYVFKMRRAAMLFRRLAAERAGEAAGPYREPPGLT